jgi:hypothetical protein
MKPIFIAIDPEEYERLIRQPKYMLHISSCNALFCFEISEISEIQEKISEIGGIEHFNTSLEKMADYLDCFNTWDKITPEKILNEISEIFSKITPDPSKIISFKQGEFILLTRLR